MTEQKTVYVNSRNNFVSKWKYLLTAVLIIVLILMIFFRIRIKVTNEEFAKQILESKRIYFEEKAAKKRGGK